MSFHKKKKGDDEERSFLMNLNHSQNDSTQMLNKDVSHNLLFKKKNENVHVKKTNSLLHEMSEHKDTSDIKSENRKIVNDSECDNNNNNNSSRQSKADISKEESKVERKIKERNTIDNKDINTSVDIKKNNNYIQDVSSVKSNQNNNKEEHTVTSGKKGNNDYSSQRDLDSRSESNISSDDDNDDNNKQRDFEPSFSDESIDQEERHYRQLLKTEKIVSTFTYVIL